MAADGCRRLSTVFDNFIFHFALDNLDPFLLLFPHNVLKMEVCMKNVSVAMKSVAMKFGVVVSALVLAPNAFGQVYWTGGGGDGNWGTAANWSNNAVPNADNANVQFTNAAAVAVSVAANYRVQQLHANGTGDVTIDIASGATFSVNGGGGNGIQAHTANITLNGPGLLALSTGGDENPLDCGARKGFTLTYNAEIVGLTSPTDTNIETYIGGISEAGTVVMGYPNNAFTRGYNLITAYHTVVVPKLANVGQPSSIGANLGFNFNTLSTLRYTGTGDTTDRAFRLNGTGGGQVEHAGTGPLVITGPVYNQNNSPQEIVLRGDSSAEARITGDIYNNQNDLSVRKEGTGLWVLAGNNSFTGGLTVNGGTLGFDSPTAPGGTTQITMGPDTALAINTLAADSFAVTIPPVVASGNISISVAQALSSSTVTFNGLTASHVAITAPGAGGAVNRIFVTGLAQGNVGPWLSLNGGPATYTTANGLAPLGLATHSLATKNDTLPNNPNTKAVIDSLGTGAPLLPIALPAALTELYSLTQDFATDDATVDTAGKTLMASEIAITSLADALTLGVAPGDGFLLPSLQIPPPSAPPVLPPSAAISNLTPLVWWDPSDAATVTLSGSKVTRLANKGVGGVSFDAVVRPNFVAPYYATGGASHSALPMLNITLNGQGLESRANTGISGSAPRTLIAVLSKETDASYLEASIGTGENNRRFTVMHYVNGTTYQTRFSIHGADINMANAAPKTPTVLSMINNADGSNPLSWQGFMDGTPSGISTGGGINTLDTPLYIGYLFNSTTTVSERGQVGEVLLFDRVLDTADRQIVEAYLLAKWKQPPPASLAQIGTLSLRNDSLANPLTVNAAVTERAADGSTLSLLKWGLGDIVLAGGAWLSGTVEMVDGGTLVVDTPADAFDTLGVTAGPGKLAKRGPGTLLLPFTAANTYTGGTDITGGTLLIGNSRSLGTGPLDIADGATLDISDGATVNALTVSNRITLAGAIVNNGPVEQMNAFCDTTVTLTGDATFGGDGNRWDFRRDVFLDLAGHTLTKSGTSPLYLFGGGGACVISNAPSAQTALHLQQGSLGIELAGLLHPNDNQRTMVIDGGAQFGMYGLTTPLHWTIQPADGAGIFTYGTDESTNKNVIASDIVLPGTLYLTASSVNYNKHLSGQISGPGGLIVTNGGLRAMSLLSHPANTFGGPVSVSNAVLGLRHPFSLPGGPSATAVTLHSNSGVRAYVCADGWTRGEVVQLAQSGIFSGNTARQLQLDIATGESISLPVLSNFGAGIDQFGPGELALDGDLTLLGGDIRTFGGTLLITNAVTLDAGRHNLSIGEATLSDGIARGDAYARFGGDAILAFEDRGYQIDSSGISVATHNTKAVLDVTDNAQVSAKFNVGGWDGTDTTSFGAVYQSGNTRWLSFGGDFNDSIIGRNGYGYYQLDDGELIMKGFTMIGSVNNGTSAGILRQTGGAIVFNGSRDTLPANGAIGDSYGGRLCISRGGKAELHLSGGTFVHYGPLSIIDSNAGGNNIAATMTVDGTADAMIDRQLEMGYGASGIASLNLNGGKLTVTHLVRRNANGSTANINFNGGTLCVTNGTERRLVLRENTGNMTAAYIYEGGATIDLAEGITRMIDIPLQDAPGYGIVSIPVANGGSGYIAPPYVAIASGANGSNATAVAHIDRVTGEVTDIEVTCPGTRYSYTVNPSVSLIGGGGTGATLGTAVRAINAPGGLTKTGPGTLILNAPCTYTGPTVIEEGILRLACPGALHPLSEIIIRDGTLDLGGTVTTNLSVTITGSGAIVNGRIFTSSAVKTGPDAATWDAGIEFGEVYRIPGLYEGYIAGNLNTTTPNPGIGTTDITLTTEAANGFVASGGSINGRNWPNNSTWVYTGYIWNRAGTNETWTFVKTFDDAIWMKIDDTVPINRTLYSELFKTNVTVTPGPHPIEIRFGQGSGEVGAMTIGAWDTDHTLSLSVDYLGRDELDPANYVRIQDSGDGFRLTATSIDTVIDDTIRIEGGTLLLPSGVAQPGLREGYLTGTQGGNGIDPTTPNLAISDGPVEPSFTAANGPYRANSGPINGKPWVNNSTYVYTGYIWNRSATNETWTFAKSFDDAIHINLDGQIWDHGTWNQVDKWQAEVSPGAHAFEVRFGQGNGGMGVTSVTSGPLAAGNEWWAFTDIALVVDYLGRNANDSANYVKLEANDGLQDGPRLTLTASPNPVLLDGIPVSASAGAALDLGDYPRTGLILSPAGDDAIGEMTVTGTANNALNGVIYHVTVHDANADTLLFTDPGPIDLTGLTIKPSDLLSETPPGNKYVIATADGFTGTPVLEGLDPKWKIIRKGTELWLTTQGGTMLLLR